MGLLLVSSHPPQTDLERTEESSVRGRGSLDRAGCPISKDEVDVLGVGKNVAAKASNNQSVQQLSTNGLQQAQYQSLKNLKFP